MDTAVFSISKSHGSVEEAARAFVGVLSDALQQPLMLHVDRSYNDQLYALSEGRAHLAWLSPLLYWKAASAGHPLAAVPERKGALAYRAALLVAEDAPWTDASALRDVKAAWVDPQSASGCVFPRQHLFTAGATIAHEAFLGSPAAAAAEVAARRADVSACAVTAKDVSEATRSVHELLGAAAAKLRVLSLSDPIPPDGLAMSPKTPAELRTRIVKALLSLHEKPQGVSALRALFRADRLVSATEASARMLRER